MGILVDGRWSEAELLTETDTSGAFQRADSRFRDWIRAFRKPRARNRISAELYTPQRRLGPV
jgi:glutathionyl-hydroquinone reductase